MNAVAHLPLRLLATDPTELFQLGFAEQARLLLAGASGVQAPVTARGVVMGGQTERELMAGAALLEAAIPSVKIGAIEIVHKSEGTIEPYFRVGMTTPAAHGGDVVGDLTRRRGWIEGREDVGDGKKPVSARAPVSTMMGFDGALAKMTRHAAQVEYTFAGYEPTQKRRAAGAAENSAMQA